MKTLDQCQQEVARKHGLGNSLVTGHRKAYFDEATKLYVAGILAEVEVRVREVEKEAKD